MSIKENDKTAILGLKQGFLSSPPPLTAPHLVKGFTGLLSDTPLNASKYGLVPKAPQKIPTTCPNTPHIALSAHTIAWIKQHIPYASGTTIRDHKTYTPYRECPPRTRIDKLIGDYLLGVGTPPDWDE